MSLVTADSLVLVDLLARGPAPLNKLVERFSHKDAIHLCDNAVRLSIRRGMKKGHIVGWGTSYRLTPEGVAQAVRVRNTLAGFLRVTYVPERTVPIGATFG